VVLAWFALPAGSLALTRGLIGWNSERNRASNGGEVSLFLLAKLLLRSLDKAIVKFGVLQVTLSRD
jgi:hypothetical protein